MKQDQSSQRCSAYVQGSDVCKNGFIQTGFCWQGFLDFYPGAKFTPPHCLREELPPHMVTDSGLPRFYKAPAATGGAK